MKPESHAATDAVKRVEAYLSEAARCFEGASPVCAPSVSEAAWTIAEAFRAGRKLLLCGNGGSAADCQHLAAEFVSSLHHDHIRAGMPAIALTTDTSLLTARANDFGFAGVFARQVETLGGQGDVLLAISTSGNSENVVAAAAAARTMSISVVGMTGDGGGRLAAECDVLVAVPSQSVQHIQELHVALCHVICELVESEMAARVKPRR